MKQEHDLVDLVIVWSRGHSAAVISDRVYLITYQ